MQESCNMKMGKEVWEIISIRNFPKGTKKKELRILDIGCGVGNALFHFHNIFKTTDFIGI